MNVDAGMAGPAEAEWVASQRKWGQGWRRILFPGVFLVYLAEVVGGVSQYSHGAAAVVGYVLLAAFCLCYLCSLPTGWQQPREFWPRYGAMVTLFVAELPLARADAFVMCVFIAVLTVSRLGGRSAPIVIGMTVLAVFLPPAIPSWHAGVSTAVDGNGTAIAIPMVSLAMFGFFNILQGNRALAEARSELARLAAENERTRIARDLHDLLGHSLTTITVKAELARRLGQRDVEAALREIGEVEALSRRALGDVRAAVANYREVTLAGELATGRELLRAAGIAADLPRTVDDVGGETQELFGWVVREGLTNVARHSHAGTCTVRISPSSVEIVDDGVGGEPGAGSGLCGLQERVEAAGGTIESGPVHPRGWRVRVSLGADATTPHLADSRAS